MISVFASLVRSKFLFPVVIVLTLISFLSDVAPILINSNVQDTYYAWKWIMLSLMPIVYFITFLSASVQVRGLIGSSGLVPYPKTLASIQSWCTASSDSDIIAIRYISVPLARSILYFFSFEASADTFVRSIPQIGMILSFLCLLIPNPLFYLILWYLYYILKRLMGPFFNLQWDALILESGLLLVLLPLPHTSLSLLLLNYTFRYVTFRLMFGSGFVKLTSGDSSWIDGSAMSYHYLTQPLPAILAPYMHSLFSWHYIMTLGTIIVEVLLPLLSFVPLPSLRAFVAVNYIGLNVAIASTGNYGFFNVLTMVLSTSLICDRVLPISPLVPASSMFCFSIMVLGLNLTVFVVLSLSYAMSLNTLFARSGQAPVAVPSILEQIQTCCNVLYTGGHYGLFANMTKFRDEITIFISSDGSKWCPIRFRFKPNISDTTITSIWPPCHLPRLDWLLWFLPLRVSQPLPHWFLVLLLGILEQREEIVSLLHANAPSVISSVQPKYICVQLYHFEYSRDKSQTNSVWAIEEGDELLPACNIATLKATIASIDNVEVRSERRKSLQATALAKALLSKLREERKTVPTTERVHEGREKRD